MALLICDFQTRFLCILVILVYFQTQKHLMLDPVMIEHFKAIEVRSLDISY